MEECDHMVLIKLNIPYGVKRFEMPVRHEINKPLNPPHTKLPLT